mmetsp:Transcript_44515/g.142740  ORF Transcript_44515/g.142740 Transcript_44515/m.142740 type:complete len:281 (-) Transcript_44515:53-895(-)
MSGLGFSGLGCFDPSGAATGFTAELCCDLRISEQGHPGCWDAVFTFEDCCVGRLTSAPPSSSALLEAAFGGSNLSDSPPEELFEALCPQAVEHSACDASAARIVQSLGLRGAPQPEGGLCGDRPSFCRLALLRHWSAETRQGELALSSAPAPTGSPPAAAAAAAATTDAVQRVAWCTRRLVALGEMDVDAFQAPGRGPMGRPPASSLPLEQRRAKSMYFRWLTRCAELQARRLSSVALGPKPTPPTRAVGGEDSDVGVRRPAVCCSCADDCRGCQDPGFG